MLPGGHLPLLLLLLRGRQQLQLQQLGLQQLGLLLGRPLLLRQRLGGRAQPERRRWRVLLVQLLQEAGRRLPGRDAGLQYRECSQRAGARVKSCQGGVEYRRGWYCAGTTTAAAYSSRL